MKARSTATKHGYARESEMCEQLCAQARALGFAVYAETADLDLLIVQRYALVNKNRPPHLLYTDVVAALRDI